MESDTTCIRRGGGEACGASLLCLPELRDPLTIALTFMRNPSPFRQCCRFTVEVWEQAVFLEGILTYPYVEYSPQPPAQPAKQKPQKTLHQEEEEEESTIVAVAGTRTTTNNSLEGVRPAMRVVPVSTLLIAPQQEPYLTNKFVVANNITSIILHKVPCVMTELGVNWLENCRMIRQVTLLSLPNLVSVGGMYRCPDLTHVVLQDLPALKRVTKFFCAGCDSLVSFELSNCPNLEDVEHFCVAQNRGLKSVVFEGLPSLEYMGGQWLEDCPSLASIRLSHLPLLDHPGDRFLGLGEPNTIPYQPNTLQVSIVGCSEELAAVVLSAANLDPEAQETVTL